jgi:hypothetical protein
VLTGSSLVLVLLSQADSGRFARKAVVRQWQRKGDKDTWQEREDCRSSELNYERNHPSSLSLCVCCGDEKTKGGRVGCGDDGMISQCDLFNTL